MASKGIIEKYHYVYDKVIKSLFVAVAGLSGYRPFNNITPVGVDVKDGGIRRKEHRAGCPVFPSKLIVIGTISFAN